MNIAFLGDIALFGKYSITNNVGLIKNLTEISTYLQKFDLVVGNLESPFSIKQKPKGAKSAYVCSDIENIDVLKALHINIVTLANNHMFDYGIEGYETTKCVLNKVGIEWFGAEGKTIELIKDGNKLLFMGYCCYSTNPLCLKKHVGDIGVNAYNIKEVMRDILCAHENGFFPIIAAHAGLEHVNYPSLDHIRAARKYAEACPYLYYGHHPHVIQGVEEFNESLIAHSLGNFCFDDVYANPSDKEPLIKLSEQNRTGLILEVTIEDNQIVDWREQMIYIGADGEIKLLANDGRLDEYNHKINCCEKSLEAYISSRNAILNARVAERKSMRNLSWFLKRLRPRYLQLALEMKANTIQYNKNVKLYL